VNDAERSRRRDFIRSHHPDVGGDPAEFVAGLAAFDDRDADAPASVPVHVVVVRRRAPAKRFTAAIRRRFHRTPSPPRVH